MVSYRGQSFVSSLPPVRIVAIFPGPHYCFYHFWVHVAPFPFMSAALLFHFLMLTIMIIRGRGLLHHGINVLAGHTNFRPTWRSFGRRWYHSGHRWRRCLLVRNIKRRHERNIFHWWLRLILNEGRFWATDKSICCLLALRARNYSGNGNRSMVAVAFYWQCALAEKIRAMWMADCR
jgi:hypothetical protein